VAFLVILNGVAALLLLGNFVRLSPQIENAPKVADAMVVFGGGVAAALASMFFAYLRRTVLLRAPNRAPSIPFGWWLAVLASVVSAVCFVGGLRMVGTAVVPTLLKSAVSQKLPKASQALKPREATHVRRERKASLALKVKKVSLALKATRVNAARRVSPDLQGQQGPPVLPDLPDLQVPHQGLLKSLRHPNRPRLEE
jgi:hypothetical protein